MHEAPVILIVDDDPHLRESVREILEYHKYACREARDGKEALISVYAVFAHFFKQIRTIYS